jgi:hypothetical protein
MASVVAPLKARLEALSPADLETFNRGIVQKALARAAEDGWWWATSFVKTRDEAAAAEASVKPFPTLPQLGAIWSSWADPAEAIYAVAKSRQIMLSWLACAFCVWTARFHPNRLVVWQSKREQDAVDMVSYGNDRHDDARMEFIEKHLPPWMQERARFRSGEIHWPNGSKIVAIPEGGHQVRSKTPSVLVMDEMAFQEQARLAVTAILPTIQKRTKLVAISTPNGKANAFWQMYSGSQER